MQEGPAHRPGLRFLSKSGGLDDDPDRNLTLELGRVTEAAALVDPCLLVGQKLHLITEASGRKVNRPHVMIRDPEPCGPSRK